MCRVSCYLALQWHLKRIYEIIFHHVVSSHDETLSAKLEMTLLLCGATVISLKHYALRVILLYCALKHVMLVKKKLH